MYQPAKPYKHRLLRSIESTWHTPYVKVTRGIYPILHKRFKGAEIQHTDGIGTKGVYHWRKKTFKNAVIDALAMNLNDLALVGAVPYAISDHLTIPDMGSRTVNEIMKALIAECRKRKIAIVGGETSHHDNIDGIDISITMSGFVGTVRKNQCRAGDVLIGFPSTGPHSNGFTKIRAMFGKGEWHSDLVKPTAIYLDAVLRLLERHTVNGMMHITGGAFTKLKDILDGKLDAVVDTPIGPQKSSIFYELYRRGIKSEEMYTTFNCGVGFVLSVPAREASATLRAYKGAKAIGRVTKGKGAVHIASAFDNSIVTL